jgi:hypothetical protein
MTDPEDSPTGLFKGNFYLLKYRHYPKVNSWRIYHVNSEKFQQHVDNADDISGQRHEHAEQWIILCKATGERKAHPAHAYFRLEPESSRETEEEKKFKDHVHAIDPQATFDVDHGAMYSNCILGYTSGIATGTHPVLTKEQADKKCKELYGRFEPK